MDRALIPVILAGGKGERFWPLSRKHRPKQFLSLDGSGQSLLQATANRLLDLAGGWEGLWVVTASHLAAGVQEQLPQLPSENLLVEPEGRDTAPAVTWSTLEIARRYGEDTIVGFFPADHWISDQAVFEQTLLQAVELATYETAIVTLGIVPRYPATGYGYIELGPKLTGFRDFSAYRVARFTEKPDYRTAQGFVASGRFSWNSGMFIFRAAVMLEELQTYALAIYGPLAEKGVEAYSEVPKKSIDYALMEQTKRAYTLPVPFGWDDLGDWNAIARLQQTENPNVELANHVGLDTKGSLLYSSNPEEAIVTIGIEDAVVVRDGNVTLIVHKNRTQDIKKVLEKLRDDPDWQHLL